MGAEFCFNGGKNRRRRKKMNTIARTLAAIKAVEEKFSKIQENPALYGAENGFTQQELELLDKLIELCGEVNIAGDAISKRALTKK
jgi:hypothetical protein